MIQHGAALDAYWTISDERTRIVTVNSDGVCAVRYELHREAMTNCVQRHCDGRPIEAGEVQVSLLGEPGQGNSFRDGNAGRHCDFPGRKPHGAAWQSSRQGRHQARLGRIVARSSAVFEQDNVISGNPSRHLGDVHSVDCDAWIDSQVSFQVTTTVNFKELGSLSIM